MRYDLIFSYKGTRQLDSDGGYKGPAYVCKVKFVAIAGHKPGRKEDVISSSENMEVWLVPVPEAHLVVPYHVSIPTPAGAASMTSERFEIETPARGRKHSSCFDRRGSVARFVYTRASLRNVALPLFAMTRQQEFYSDDL